MYTGDLIPIEDKSIPFTLFLTFRMLFANFGLENLIMTLFGTLRSNQWQSSILEESILTSSFLNNLRAVSSSSEFSTNLGMSDSDRNTVI